MPTIILSSRAKRDLKRLDRPVRARIVDALRDLEKDAPPDNLDIKPLTGHAPWRRLRVGDWRVVFYLEDDEILVERVVNRGDLHDAARRL